MQHQDLAAKNLNIYIYGWKGLATYFGVHVRTLQRWDKKLKIRWDKSGSKKNDSVRIHVLVADYYYKIFRSSE